MERLTIKIMKLFTIKIYQKCKNKTNNFNKQFNNNNFIKMDKIGLWVQLMMKINRYRI